MLKFKPNLNLVDNDCFINNPEVCDYRSDMGFNELMREILNETYGKIAINPDRYSSDDLELIRKMSARYFVSLYEFPTNGGSNDIFDTEPSWEDCNEYTDYSDGVLDEIPFEDSVITKVLKSLSEVGDIDISITKR